MFFLFFCYTKVPISACLCCYCCCCCCSNGVIFTNYVRLYKRILGPSQRSRPPGSQCNHPRFSGRHWSTYAIGQSAWAEHGQQPPCRRHGIRSCRSRRRLHHSQRPRRRHAVVQDRRSVVFSFFFGHVFYPLTSDPVSHLLFVFSCSI